MKRLDKARAYHRKVCHRTVRWDGVIIWMFFYGNGLYSKWAENPLT